MKDKLDELHYIYKMIGNYGFCTVQELLDKYIEQKEFINYLENMLDDENDIFSVVRVKEVLQKYKEMIGEKDENK